MAKGRKEKKTLACHVLYPLWSWSSLCYPQNRSNYIYWVKQRIITIKLHIGSHCRFTAWVQSSRGPVRIFPVWSLHLECLRCSGFYPQSWYMYWCELKIQSCPFNKLVFWINIVSFSNVTKNVWIKYDIKILIK